jgi:hypothetical protein
MVRSICEIELDMKAENVNAIDQDSGFMIYAALDDLDAVSLNSVEREVHLIVSIVEAWYQFYFVCCQSF